MKLVLGLGCDRNTSLETLEGAIENALKSVKMNKFDISQLATIDKKNDELALLQLAEKYQWPLQFFSAEQLSKVKVPSPSAIVLKYMGTPSVSEAAAILAAQSNRDHLIVEKYKYLGAEGKNATVSIVKI
ncbi:MAG: cobalamin biosynthesis protein [Methylococcales symbiont of Iophon sp. n. MRB-2018]|nr:MAG: cobalamin biosynthesis protein [Methylococcales symbiont of Iophon sp. n. MRB-2018]KAF3980078.1 MAG: cobalamin biosynthesis protein [Methylococcales symbiont of Iophon sp. n. MRB-2018]